MSCKERIKVQTKLEIKFLNKRCFFPFMHIQYFFFFFFYWQIIHTKCKGTFSVPLKFSLAFLAMLFLILFQDFDENDFVE